MLRHSSELDVLLLWNVYYVVSTESDMWDPGNLTVLEDLANFIDQFLTGCSAEKTKTISTFNIEYIIKIFGNQQIT